MKAIIRKTGEIVDIVSYSGGTVRCDILDRVSYIDSKGIEHDRETLNYYWDFEQIDVKEDAFSKIDWEQRRYEIAKEMLPYTAETSRSILMSGHGLGDDAKGKTLTEVCASSAVSFADALIEELKKEVKLDNEKFNVDQAIPITVEWLVKNGFTKEHEELCYSKEIMGCYIDITFGLSNRGEGHVVCHVDNNDRQSIGCVDIRYVHQLQNLLNILNIDEDFI